MQNNGIDQGDNVGKVRGSFTVGRWVPRRFRAVDTSMQEQLQGDAANYQGDPQVIPANNQQTMNETSQDGIKVVSER